MKLFVQYTLVCLLLVFALKASTFLYPQPNRNAGPSPWYKPSPGEERLAEAEKLHRSVLEPVMDPGWRVAVHFANPYHRITSFEPPTLFGSWDLFLSLNVIFSGLFYGGLFASIHLVCEKIFKKTP